MIDGSALAVCLSNAELKPFFREIGNVLTGAFLFQLTLPVNSTVPSLYG